MVGKVISDEGVEQLGVVREMGGGKSHELTGSGRRGVRGGPGEEIVGLVADDCGGDEQQGELAVLARSKISAGAVASLPISRRIRSSMSSGMGSLWRGALMIR